MSVTNPQQKDKLPRIGFLDTLAAVASIQERADTLPIQSQDGQSQDHSRNGSFRNYEKGSSSSSGGSVVTESISAQSSSMNTNNSSGTNGTAADQGFISNDAITPSESASNVSNGMFLQNLPRYDSSLNAASKNCARTTLTPMIQSTSLNSSSSNAAATSATANEYDRILQSEERRRLRNREAAQRYRHKQVERMDELEQRIHQLEQQNEEMRYELEGLEKLKMEMEEILKKRSTNCIHK